jgi:cytochrome c-type biogenesis protein CcmE
MDEDELLQQIRREEVADEPEPVAAAPAPARRRAAPAPTWWERIPVWVKIGVIFGVLGGGVVFLLSGTGASDAFVYSKLVDEVMVAPDDFVGRELRVEGQLRQGSVRFVDEPSCEHTFVLHRGGHEMPVRFPRCVVPDTFRDDMPVDVVVQGQLQTNGTFLANEVIPRCPSKYDMEERARNGEQAPHSLTNPPSRS